MFLAVLSGLRRQDGGAPRRVAAEGRGQGDHVQLPPDAHGGSVEFQRAKAPVPTRGSVRVRLFVWRSKAGCPVVATSQWPLRRAPRPFARAFQTHAVFHVLFAHLILLLACFLPAALPRQTPHTAATRQAPPEGGFQDGTDLSGEPNNWACPRTVLVLRKRAPDKNCFSKNRTSMEEEGLRLDLRLSDCASGAPTAYYGGPPTGSPARRLPPTGSDTPDPAC